MSTSKKILLTFDYELFFKKSGTPENCLLKPVDALIEYMQTHKIRATFFIDVMYYLRMTQENQETIEKSKYIKEQIQKLVHLGHKIELHLHPHWLDAVYESGEWLFPTYKRYALQNMNENKITELFRIGTDTLESIARDAISGYKVTAFRAGGWNVVPFNKLRRGFEENGIIIDSSIVQNMRSCGEQHCFDYSGIDDEYYFFSDNPMEKMQYGPFMELPISTFKKSLFDKLRCKIYTANNRHRFKCYGDGLTMAGRALIIGKLQPIINVFTLELCPELIKAKLKNSKKNVIICVSHPKELAPVSFLTLEAIRQEGCEFLTTGDMLRFAKGQ